MSYRILLAEDEPSLRNMTAEYLRGQGFTVDAVWNGEEAEWAVNQNRYDAVILDIMMPKKSGQDVCRTIRARYDVPVIFLTALNAEDVIVESYGIGADEYITKPFSNAILLAGMRNMTIIITKKITRHSACAKRPNPCCLRTRCLD